MITVANCISGPAELAGWIKDSFEATFGTLQGVPGVRAFRLRRLDGTRDGRCMFVSFTMWDNLADFEHWRRSAAFIAAHPDRTRFANAFARMRSVRMDFATTSEPSAADLDSRVLARLTEAHPDLVAEGPLFVEEVTWSREAVRPRAPSAVAPSTGRHLWPTSARAAS